MTHKTTWGTGVLRSLGLVFGDIGTSPIYTMTVVVALTAPTEQHILGVLSLIFWTLALLVTVEYAWLAMSLGTRGEGGTIVLKELLVSLVKSGRQAAFFSFLGYIGISLLIGDGVITPAISILSAVEGLLLIPGLEATPTKVLMAIAGLIAIALFSVERRGTERVAGAFGPIMLLWFGVLHCALRDLLHRWAGTFRMFIDEVSRLGCLEPVPNENVFDDIFSEFQPHYEVWIN